ncbi:MAG: bactofilin family protein [Hyphomicrobiaceae bacterium]
MFSRNSDKEPPRVPEQSPLPPPPPPPRRPAPLTNGLQGSGPGPDMTSVIGSDLTIIGSGLRIIAQRTLQVDGEIQGDVLGSRVVIGPTGKVTGLVNAQDVQVNGSVFGTIRGVDVTLAASAIVEGDIYHQSITLEQGASFEGRSRRPKDRSELVPDLTDTSGAVTGYAEDQPLQHAGSASES